MRFLQTLIVILNILIVISIILNVIAAEETCDKTNEVRDCDHQPERTFIAIKPDAVQRGLVGEILSRFERKGFKSVAMSMMSASRELEAVRGLEQTVWPGRNQTMTRDSTVFYLDGAHTEESICSCVDWFYSASSKSGSVFRVLIFNTTGDREVRCLLGIKTSL